MMRAAMEPANERWMRVQRQCCRTRRMRKDDGRDLVMQEADDPFFGKTRVDVQSVSLGIGLQTRAYSTLGERRMPTINEFTALITMGSAAEPAGV